MALIFDLFVDKLTISECTVYLLRGFGNFGENSFVLTGVSMNIIRHVYALCVLLD